MYTNKIFRDWIDPRPCTADEIERLIADGNYDAEDAAGAMVIADDGNGSRLYHIPAAGSLCEFAVEGHTGDMIYGLNLGDAGVQWGLSTKIDINTSYYSDAVILDALAQATAEGKCADFDNCQLSPTVIAFTISVDMIYGSVRVEWYVTDDGKAAWERTGDQSQACDWNYIDIVRQVS